MGYLIPRFGVGNAFVHPMYEPFLVFEIAIRGLVEYLGTRAPEFSRQPVDPINSVIVHTQRNITRSHVRSR